jgi:futalosine hydrolase
VSRPAYGGVAIDDFLLVHAAAVEARALQDVPTLSLGVGKTAAAVSLYGALRARPATRAVLLFGVAGAFPERHRDGASPVRPGDVCVVGEDRFGDEGVETPQGFEPIRLAAMYATARGEVLGDPGLFPAHRRMATEAARRLGVPVLRGVTVSTCSGTDARSRELRARSGADVESMEGAAVAYVCQKAELPLLHLRAISNWTGDRGDGQWNLGEAVDALGRAVRRLCASD